MLIELVDVGFTYMPGTTLEQRALSHVSLRIAEGELIGLVGPTGSGKSTLIQHLNGLLHPTEGTVLFDGRALGAGIHPDEVREKVGVVFQFPENQLFEETIAADIAFGPKNLGLPGDEIELRVHRAMGQVGLDYDRYAHRSPFDISGGEKRLVALAGVLAMRPSVLVLDEPTAGLDARGRALIMERVVELNGGGMTVVLVDHDMDEVAECAGRVVVLHAGRVALDGSPEEVFSHAEFLESIHLGAPKATELLLKLKRRGLPVDSRAVGFTPAIDAVLAAVKEARCR